MTVSCDGDLQRSIAWTGNLVEKRLSHHDIDWADAIEALEGAIVLIQLANQERNRGIYGEDYRTDEERKSDDEKELDARNALRRIEHPRELPGPGRYNLLEDEDGKNVYGFYDYENGYGKRYCAVDGLEATVRIDGVYHCSEHGLKITSEVY